MPGPATDSLHLGPDATARHALDMLREDAREGALGQDPQVAPGVALHADPALGMTGTWRSPPGRLLEIEARPARPGSWFGLHVSLGGCDLDRHGIVGFACRTRSSELQILRACLRSGIDARPGGAFVDRFFDKHILSQPVEGSHLDALPARGHEALPAQAPWRELILFLPTEGFDWSLIDLRLFIV